MEPGLTTTKAEGTKQRKYGALDYSFRFEPVALESAGIYGNTTSSLISEIGRRVSEVSGDPRETYWLEQRISLAVQRARFSVYWQL